MYTLSPSDRDFFQVVADACLANPFSEERQVLNRAMSADSAEASQPELVRAAVETVRQRVAALSAKGRATYTAYRAEDAAILRKAFLFDVFHQHVPAFDELIARERDQPTNRKLAFAAQAIHQLDQHGFTPDEADRLFGMCYQMRRAYFFIYRNLVGDSPSMQQLRLALWYNVFTHSVAWYEQTVWNRMEDFSTLLLGETGSGKGAAAAAIGYSGFIPYNRATQRFEQSFNELFTAINLAQYQESLIESELFGHKRGAFTGAVQGYDGILSQSRPYGTLFLDEIGDVTLPVQTKLLRVLQERVFSQVGSHDPLRFEGRVIAATNHDLESMRLDGRFRDDFYYRLCSDRIQIPPLRQRIRENARELGAMVNHIVTRILGVEQPDIANQVLARLRSDVGDDYGWPGNVRELEQAIRSILLTGTYGGDPAQQQEAGRSLAGQLQQGRMTAQDLLAVYCQKLYETYQSYADVAKVTELDWRTVKKYVESG